jgi:hypothetical protein
MALYLFFTGVHTPLIHGAQTRWTKRNPKKETRIAEAWFDSLSKGKDEDMTSLVESCFKRPEKAVI